MNWILRAGFVAIAALSFFIITSVDPTNLVTEGSTAASPIFATPATPVAEADTNRQSPTSPSNTTANASPAAQPVTTLPAAATPTVTPATTLPAYVPPTSSSGGNPPSQSTPAPTAPTKSKHVIAWLHAQDWEKSVASLIAHASVISQASPAWYQANADGSVSARSGSHVDEAQFLTAVRSSNIKLIPLVMSVPGAGASPAKIVELFKDERLRHKHIETLVSLAVEKNYDGLDIDYESIPVKNLPELATFIEELAAALHAQGKQLSVSIDTQPATSVLAPWARIGAAADSVRLMAYGIPYKTPQPVVDLSWMEARLTHALKAIPKEKLSLGIPLYCNKWSATGRTSSTWEKLGKEKNVSVACSDGATAALETAVATRHGVSSFALWRLGGEDPAVWNLF